MPAFLVTGNPGSGKSSVADELARRGLSTIDPDCDPGGLSYWEDPSGQPVDGPSMPDDEWLASHRWVWNRSRLKEILADQKDAVFVCGIARNQHELLDLFDRVFLLRIDELTQEARLVSHDERNPPGRSEAGRQEIRRGRPFMEAEMLRQGAVPLDGTLPTVAVVSSTSSSIFCNSLKPFSPGVTLQLFPGPGPLHRRAGVLRSRAA